ncbi:asparaginase domain-containing protein [Aquirhabdus sp.]|uniref:asparaginase domain-containing protein n=1 Tax=Aquirhabdus sp. TaxID=2824160 RepID=UPI00396CC24E
MPNTLAMHLGILYLGGTIGCAGTPLTPLAAEIFLPHLKTIISEEIFQPLQSDVYEVSMDTAQVSWHFYSGEIKDSSALVPEDWADILALLLHPDQQHIKHWIILHGTDTLAFTAAFLETALQGNDLNIVVTGSQLPLLHPVELTLDRDSDALGNLKTAYRTLNEATTHEQGWVRVAFHQQNWAADTVQKIHTQELTAFSGRNEEDHTAQISTHNKLPYLSRRTDFALLKEQLSTTNIQIYYASPLPSHTLAEQLEHVLTSGVDAVILMAYGLGNFPDDLRIHRALLAAEQRGVMVVITTQVPFGGVETRYAAGNWLTACGVLSAKILPLPAIFAKLAWLLITEANFIERRKKWLALTA